VSPIYAPDVHLATSILAIGWPDDQLTQTQAEYLYVGGLVICAVAIIFVIRRFQQLSTRLVVVGLIAVVAGFLYYQHDLLGDCAGQCTCEMFGRELAIRDEDAFCPD
jgi:hypothetical protein